MKRERMILYVNLLAHAAMGDQTAQYLLDGIDGPQQLLNADLDQGEADQG